MTNFVRHMVFLAYLISSGNAIASEAKCRDVFLTASISATQADEKNSATITNNGAGTIRFCLSGEVMSPDDTNVWSPFPFRIEDGRPEKAICKKTLAPSKSVVIPWNRKLVNVPQQIRQHATKPSVFRFRADVITSSESGDASCVAVSPQFIVRHLFESKGAK